jgi:hypothetical protein
MAIQAQIREALNSQLQRFRHRVVDERILYEWQMTDALNRPGFRASTLPEGAADYLVMSNPRLADLRARYGAFNSDVTTPLVWTDSHVTPEDMLYFRGDNAYVWQVRERGLNILAYALAAYYIQSIDELGLWKKLQEDDAFGIHTFTIANRLLSRDLLDSICEIHFLEKHLNISSRPQLSVMDIGAGYGRLAHRMVSALPNLARYLCTDAFPISTFVCEYYLRFRHIDDRAIAVPLDEIDQTLSAQTVDLAVNIHSFSECKASAIDWWLSLLEKHGVKYLMIVPNTGDALRTHEGIDFSDIVEKHGYSLKVKEPKYRDPVVQQYALNPAYYFLFERR